MLHEKLTQWLRQVLPPDTDDGSPHPDMGTIDNRLSSIEKEQEKIDMRLRILERRADPRGIGEGLYDA